jgi:hypothetical protein
MRSNFSVYLQKVNIDPMSLYRLHIAMIATFILPVAAFAQQIRVTNATIQGWAGGMAGHSGTYMNFTLKFSGSDSKPLLHTIWLKGEGCVQLFEDTGDGNFNLKIIKKKGDWIATIHVSTYHDEYAARENLNHKPQSESKQLPPKPYSGVALIVYNVAGIEKYFNIPKYYVTLPQINYP